MDSALNKSTSCGGDFPSQVSGQSILTTNEK